jgi:16S rRNA (guanine527-N7)-methyltransferase
MTSLSREDVERKFNVSRETMARLDIHAALLKKWSPKINLVSKDTLEQVWYRHIADSAQLWMIQPLTRGLWLDLGSGAGFPGLVIAALAADHTGTEFRLIESDARKCAFLQSVIREANLPAQVVTARIEALAPQSADVISARALTSLTGLLEMTEKHRNPDGIGLFHKGRTVHKEVAEAQERWRFIPRLHRSQTDPNAAIVEIGDLDRV